MSLLVGTYELGEVLHRHLFDLMFRFGFVKIIVRAGVGFLKDQGMSETCFHYYWKLVNLGMSRINNYWIQGSLAHWFLLAQYKTITTDSIVLFVILPSLCLPRMAGL